VTVLSGLQRFLQPWAKWLVSQFPQLRVTSVRRSRTEQLRLWNTRARNRYPVAPPGRSLHEYGLAWDMVGPIALLRAAGHVWNAVGGHWSETDAIHFEYRGRSIARS
jgi:hypothetical protein